MKKIIFIILILIQLPIKPLSFTIVKPISNSVLLLDNKLIISCSNDETFFYFVDKTEKNFQKKYEKNMKKIILNHNDSKLLIAFEDEVHIYNFNDNLTYNLTRIDIKNPILDIEFDKTSDRIIIATEKSILVYQINNNQLKKLYDIKYVNKKLQYINIIPYIDYAVIITDKHSIIYDLKDESIICTFRSIGSETFRDVSEPIIHYDISGDGTKLLTTTKNNTKIWDLKTLEHYPIGKYSGKEPSAIFSKDSKKMIFYIENNLWIIDLSTKKTIATLNHLYNIKITNVSQNSKKIITITYNKKNQKFEMNIWDALKSKLIAQIPINADHIQTSIDPEGNKVLLTKNVIKSINPLIISSTVSLESIPKKLIISLDEKKQSKPKIDTISPDEDLSKLPSPPPAPKLKINDFRLPTPPSLPNSEESWENSSMDTQPKSIPISKSDSSSEPSIYDENLYGSPIPSYNSTSPYLELHDDIKKFLKKYLPSPDK
jgi:hypothetical protein